MSPRSTVIAFLALLALTATTFALSRIPLGWAEAPVALGIGGLKALIVGGVFMELLRDRFGNRAALVVAAALVLALVAFATLDVVTRP